VNVRRAWFVCLVLSAEAWSAVPPNRTVEAPAPEEVPSCATGDDCVALGRKFAACDGERQSWSMARALFHKACARDEESDGCALEAVLVAHGRGGPADVPAALLKLRRSCRSGGGAFCNDLGVSKDRALSFTYLEKACSLGLSFGCTRMGLYLQGHGETEKANQLYLRACELKEDVPCYELAVNESTGNGIAADQQGAATHYTEACNLKFGAACTNLGNGYAVGRGVTYDPVKAFSLYQEACRLKDPLGCKSVASFAEQFARLSTESCITDRSGNGCHNLGLAYLCGIGETEDLEEARKFFTKSCAMKDRGGCNHLAEISTGELGSRADWATAHAVYQTGCTGGDGASCNELGYFLETGKGAKADRARAQALYQRGCDLDDFASCENLAAGYDRAGDSIRATALRAKAATLKQASH
jgi:TPR repeat protein